MRMNIEQRLRRLEGATREEACPGCGYAEGGRRTLRCVFGDEPWDGPERCEACGRRLVLTLEFDSAG